MNSYNQWSEYDLKLQIIRDNQDIGWAEDTIKDARKRLSDVQAELDRRQLAAFWQQHPELVPVAVGDKLLVTQEAYDSKVLFEFPMGSIISFDKVDIFDTHLSYNLHSHTGVWLFDSGEIVNNMRRTYLATQQPATKANEGD